MRDYTLHDSGGRQQFVTGAVRDRQAGKGRFDLLPALAVTRLARHFEKGAAKYGDRNWEQGIPLSRFLDSALRHLFAYLRAGTMRTTSWPPPGTCWRRWRPTRGRMPAGSRPSW